MQVFCGFGNRNPYWKTSFYVQCLVQFELFHHLWVSNFPKLQVFEVREITALKNDEIMHYTVLYIRITKFQLRVKCSYFWFNFKAEIIFDPFFLGGISNLLWFQFHYSFYVITLIIMFYCIFLRIHFLFHFHVM